MRRWELEGFRRSLKLYTDFISKPFGCWRQAQSFDCYVRGLTDPSAARDRERDAIFRSAIMSESGRVELNLGFSKGHLACIYKCQT